jgi:hypothetical protein
MVALIERSTRRGRAGSPSSASVSVRGRVLRAAWAAVVYGAGPVVINYSVPIRLCPLLRGALLASFDCCIGSLGIFN